MRGSASASAAAAFTTRPRPHRGGGRPRAPRAAAACRRLLRRARSAQPPGSAADLRDDAAHPGPAQSAALGQEVRDRVGRPPQGHRRQTVADDHDERHRVRVPHQLAAEQEPRPSQRIRERRLAAQRNRLEAPPGKRDARRRRQRDRRLGHPAAERDQRDLVAAARRVLEQLEHHALHLLDHPLGVHRPAVVDDEADRERRAVLAGPCGGDRRRDLDRARPGRRGPHRRVERQVHVAGPREPVAEYFPAASADERACPTPRPCPFDRGRRGGGARTRRPGRRRPPRRPASPRALRSSSVYDVARSSTFFRLTSISSASSSSRWRT